MKKDIKWHKIHADGLNKRELTRPERVKRRKHGELVEKRLSNNRKTILVPEILDFFNNFDESILFINNIHSTIFDENAFVFLNFSSSRKISLEACVVLAAEIDRCTRIRPKSVNGNYPSTYEVYFVLNALGFFQMLHIQTPRPIAKDELNIEIVRLSSGIDNPENLMKGMKELFYSEDGSKPKTVFCGSIYGALTEAMGNAVEHAYPISFRQENEKTCIPRWWRAGFKDNTDNKVVLVLYDQGAGIPNTLEKNWSETLGKFLKSIIGEPYDKDKLAFAMKQGRSRTKVEGRGQGSYDIQELIRESANGMLNILSYKGSYVYHNTEKWETKTLPHSLKGSMIVWQVCLNTIEEKLYEKNN